MGWVYHLQNVVRCCIISVPSIKIKNKKMKEESILVKQKGMSVANGKSLFSFTALFLPSHVRHSITPTLYYLSQPLLLFIFLYYFY